MAHDFDPRYVPLLVWMYVRLAHAEERDALREFGGEYERYAAMTPRWIPRWSTDAAPTAYPPPDLTILTLD